VRLYECVERNPDRDCRELRSRADSGAFFESAGPVSLRTGRHCVFAVGNIEYRGMSHLTGVDGRSGAMRIPAKYCGQLPAKLSA
jgi:hypothetical protein